MAAATAAPPAEGFVWLDLHPVAVHVSLMVHAALNRSFLSSLPPTTAEGQDRSQ